MLQLQKKLSEIKIFDPACGSGNFLTESFISLRRIENEILKLLFGSQIQLGELVNLIKVSISQFYGVEINDFAVAVAQTALWIAELQMIQETQEIIHRDLDFLPLKSYSNIVEGNSLQLDWQKLFEVDRLAGWQVDSDSTNLPTYTPTNLKHSTLADLYDELSMPKDLRDAHRKNDLAVAKAYGWEKFFDDEPKITAELLKLYKNLAES